MTKTIQPPPAENRNPKDPGTVLQTVIDDTKGHRDYEKQNIDEQGERANVKQNTSNRRSG